MPDNPRAKKIREALYDLIGEHGERCSAGPECAAIVEGGAALKALSEMQEEWSHDAERYERAINAIAAGDAERYERAIKAIAACTLTGPAFGDWVQSVCEDLLAGLEAECWNCGTAVHDGPCVEDVMS